MASATHCSTLLKRDTSLEDHNARMDTILSNTKVFTAIKSLQWITRAAQDALEEEKGDRQRILLSYLNKQNLRIAREVKVPSLRPASVEGKYPLRQQQDSYGQDMELKHEKDGVMRRNKLLLEHIMHERCVKERRVSSSIQYYNEKKQELMRNSNLKDYENLASSSLEKEGVSILEP